MSVIGLPPVSGRTKMAHPAAEHGEGEVNPGTCPAANRWWAPWPSSPCFTYGFFVFVSGPLSG